MPKGPPRLLGWTCALVTAACAPTIPLITPADASRAGVEYAALASGRETYVARCGGCHRLFRPGERTLAEWRALLPAMSDEAKLAPGELAAIEGYLAAFARPTPAPATARPTTP